MNETRRGTRPAEMLPRSGMVGREKSEQLAVFGGGERKGCPGVSREARRQKLHDNFSSIDPEV